MISLNAVSLSGMRAAQVALGTAAHNIANLPTPGFRRQQVELATAGAGGVAATVSKAATPGPALVDDLVATVQARQGFAANLQVFRAADRMTGSLIDALA